MKKIICLLSLITSFTAAFPRESVTIDSIKLKLNISTDEEERISLFNDLAWEYSLSNFDSAEKYTTRAILLADKMGDLYWQAVSYEMKAILYEISGQYEKAINLYMKVISLHEKLGGNGLEKTFNNVAILFKSQNNYQKALEYLEKAYRIELQNNNKKGVISSLINMSNFLNQLGQIDSSFSLSKKALAMAHQIDDDVSVVHASINMAERYQDINSDSTLFYISNVIDRARKFEMYYPLALILQMTADIYIEKKKFKSALEFLREAELLATNMNMKEVLRGNYQSQAKAFEGLKSYDKAYSTLWKYISINDSLINDHTIAVLNDLEKKYETAKKDQNIAQLNELNARIELKSERQASITRLLIFGGVFFIILSLLLLFSMRQRLKNQKLMAQKNEEVKTTNFKRKLTELELKALRSQMNPHFIFNCMNSINTMILNGESDAASRYLNKFSKLIRKTLENSESTTISLEDELSMLETYIQLEAVRFQGRISYDISVDSKLDPSSIRLPSMVLQPFIENAIWHGLLHKEGPGELKVEFREKGDELECTIEDNGVGRKKALNLVEASTMKKKSMGIELTKERLKIINKSNVQDWIHIIDLKDPLNNGIGTRVKINIPIN